MKRRMYLAVFIVLTVMLAVPLINYGFYSWAHDRAYRDFVSPQHDNRVVILNSRLLPKYKFDLLARRSRSSIFSFETAEQGRHG
ncbi:MAG: hypothetical protein ACKVK8_06555 [Rhodospirillales bacterium]